MALEPSDGLIYNIWVNWRQTWRCILSHTANTHFLCVASWEKSKEIILNIRKRTVDLYKSGSSLGKIFRCLKVPCSSVQAIICKYKHHGNVQTSYHLERRRFCVPEMNVLWCQICASTPEQKQNILWSCWLKPVRESHYPQWNKQHHVVKAFRCRRNWCTSQNRWHH